jgi:multisubunit Na+/H+ antiporter MnhF subunit
MRIAADLIIDLVGIFICFGCWVEEASARSVRMILVLVLFLFVILLAARGGCHCDGERREQDGEFS